MLLTTTLDIARQIVGKGKLNMMPMMLAKPKVPLSRDWQKSGEKESQ